MNFEDLWKATFLGLRGRDNVGLLAQYQALSTDAASVTADQAKLAADQTTDTTDQAAFLAALGTGAVFPGPDVSTVILVVPSSTDPRGYTTTPYPVAS